MAESQELKKSKGKMKFPKSRRATKHGNWEKKYSLRLYLLQEKRKRGETIGELKAKN